jgi:hypothetical protein
VSLRGGIDRGIRGKTEKIKELEIKEKYSFGILLLLLLL